MTELFNTHPGIMRKHPLDQVIYRIMSVFLTACWFQFTSLLFLVIKIIEKHVFRIKTKNPVPEEREFGEEEQFTSNFSFKFEYQIPEFNSIGKVESSSIVEPKAMNFIGRGEENTESNFIPAATDESCVGRIHKEIGSKCLSEKDYVKLFTESKDDIESEVDEPSISTSEESNFSSEKYFKSSYTESGDDLFIGRTEKIFQVLSSKDETDTNESLRSEYDNLGEEKPIDFETKSLYEKESREGFSGFDSDSDSISSSDGYSVKNLVIDSDGFLSEKDFGDEEESLMDSNAFEVELMEGIGNFDEGESSNSNAESSIMNSPNGFQNIYDGFLSNEDLLHTLQSFSAENQSPMESSVHSLSLLDETWSENDSGESPASVPIELMDSNDNEIPSNLENNIPDKETESDSSNANHLSPINGANRDEKNVSEEDDFKKSHVEDLNDEESDELESLWEHQDLIEQLKMEIKKAKAVGLPTILEESESPKMSEDLKPWKFDAKFLREDPLDELHKFYRSYRERMRKFDILNYQKMYAMGFLQLKNPLQSMGSQKPLIPTILAHISQNLWPLYRRKSSTNASENFIKELQVELEKVYVGQTCLSWEFLRWQYEKARELPESDPYRNRQYNQVAGDFQQFQVILQRFIEDESFQGPRLPNYVKNRCILRNLLQVPVIKEDCLKNKKEEKRRGKDAITSEMLEDIMEESIRILWEFIKADKDDNSVILKGLIGSKVELQDSADYNLLQDVQNILQKKDKRLKDILKTGNCIVKKFKKPREDRSNQDLFFSQVDMKLVARVLKMSRITTDQLVWCHKKLNKIKVEERKIHREPSFLLFPC